MNKSSLIVLILIIHIGYCFAQVNSGKGKYPFPQNRKYQYGIKPSQANSNDALASYNDWKNQFLINFSSNPNVFGVNFNGAYTTVSEGIGYGMLMAAYANDSVTFNGLWRFYKRYSYGGLMNWEISSTGAVLGGGPATDADEDAAMALVIAYNQWPSTGAINYKQDCINLINAIMSVEVETGTWILKPGDYGGSSLVNISYFAPAYYRIFAQVTGDNHWLNVVDTCYKIIAGNANSTTGLVSDWAVGTTGAPTNPNNGDVHPLDFYYDAIRTPWRLTIDYIWFGEKRAQSYCTKMARFINGKGGVTKISDGYTLTGNSIGSNGDGTFMGPLCLTGMVSPSLNNYLFDGYYANISHSEIGTKDYFGHSLQSLAFFVMTGNFYPLPPPICSKPDLGPSRSLCDSASFTLNPNIPYSSIKKFIWNTGDTTNTLTVNQKGLYTLTIDSADCQTSDSVYISGLKIEMPNQINISPGSSVTLSAGSSGSGVQYYWRLGSLNTTPFDTTNETIMVSLPGKYYLTVDSGGCVNTDSVTVGGQDFLLYPNPNNGAFTIEPLASGLSSLSVTIYSVNNGILKTISPEQQYTISSFPQKLTFNFSGLAPGMYVARVIADGTVYIKKFIIIY